MIKLIRLFILIALYLFVFQLDFICPNRSLTVR